MKHTGSPNEEKILLSKNQEKPTTNKYTEINSSARYCFHVAIKAKNWEKMDFFYGLLNIFEDSRAKIGEQAPFCSSIGEYRIFEPQWPPLAKL